MTCIIGCTQPIGKDFKDYIKEHPEVDLSDKPRYVEDDLTAEKDLKRPKSKWGRTYGESNE